MMLTVSEVGTVDEFLVSLDFCTKVCATGKSAKFPLGSVPPWLCPRPSFSMAHLPFFCIFLFSSRSAASSESLCSILQTPPNYPHCLLLPPSIPITHLGKEALLQSESIATDVYTALGIKSQ